VKKLIIEVRANEYTMRDGNPNVPWSAEELGRDAAACRAAGATIYHFHARHLDGSPDHRVESYADAIRGIRAVSDLLVHPTLGAITLDLSGPERLAHIEVLCTEPQTRPDFAPMDVGSTNADVFDPDARQFKTTNAIYRNSTETLLFFAKRIPELGIKPYVMSWNIPFTRQIDAFLKMGVLRAPLFLAFNLTDGHSLAGHPGTLPGLQAHLNFLPDSEGLQWTACNHGGDLQPLLDSIISLGGHVSIGLGDYSYRGLGSPTNADLVHLVAKRARMHGREIATPIEARAMLGMEPRAE
jgi:3-keto-5-aminohexanoate cleavage enzyme